MNLHFVTARRRPVTNAFLESTSRTNNAILGFLWMAMAWSACQPVAALTTTQQPRRRNVLDKSPSRFPLLWAVAESRQQQEPSQGGLAMDKSATSSSTPFDLPLRQRSTWPDVAPLPVVGDQTDKDDMSDVLAMDPLSSMMEASSSAASESNKSTTEHNHNPPRVRDFRFAAPLLEFGYPPAVQDYRENRTTSKPLLLFLPGFDATYLSAFFQYPELHTLFEVRCLVSSMEDRSTFDEMKESTVEFVLDQLATAAATTKATDNQQHDNSELSTEASKQTDSQSSSSPWHGLSSFFWRKTISPDDKDDGSAQDTIGNRHVYIAGESFGGILACEVALALMDEQQLEKNIKGLVLINSATCYDRSKLAAEAPPVTRLHKNLYLFGLLKLLPMFLDDISLPQFWTIIQGKALPSVIDNPVREAYMGRLAFSLPFLLKFMPQDTLEWRLTQWLEVGCSRMATQIADLANHRSLRTLIIAGEKDMVLPSIAEAERLAQILPNSQVHVVDGAGHANTCGSRLDLAAMMRNHYVELRTKPHHRRKSSRNDGAAQNQQEDSGGRTAMKPVAAQGHGILFGMEPRYDGRRIGLNPLSYWSDEYYQKIDNVK